jgi:hypothetical protein
MGHSISRRMTAHLKKQPCAVCSAAAENSEQNKLRRNTIVEKAITLYASSEEKVREE